MSAKLTEIFAEGFQRAAPMGAVTEAVAEGFQVASDLGCITSLFVEVFQFGIPEPTGGTGITVSAGAPRGNRLAPGVRVVSAGQPTRRSLGDE